MPADEAQHWSTGPEEDDLYALLELRHSASRAELKRAWRRLAAQLHPDAQRPESHPSAAEASHQRQQARLERFLAVRRAYSILSDPARRQAYDRALAEQRQPAISLFARPRRAPRDSGQQVPNPWGQQVPNPWTSPARRALASAVAVVRGRSTTLLGTMRTHWALLQLPARISPWVQRLATLPWASLVRVRALSVAFVGGLVILWTSLPAPQPAKPSLDASAASTLARSHEAGYGDSNARQEGFTRRSSNDWPTILAVPATRPPERHGASAGGGPAPSTGQAAQQQPASAPGHAAAATSSDDRRADWLTAELSALRPEHNGPPWTQIPQWELPGGWRQPARSSSLHGAWLAGCHQDGQIWAGKAQMETETVNLSWQRIGKQAMQGQESFPIGPPGGAITPPGDRGPSPRDGSLERRATGRAPTEPAMHLHPISDRMMRMELSSDAPTTAPCRTWILASAESIEWLSGRWVLAERPRDQPELGFRARFLQLQLQPGDREIVAQLRGLYAVGSGAIGLSATRSAAILPEVAFTATAEREGFAGTLRWHQPDFGEGILHVAPLGEHSIAIRWIAERLSPGRPRVSGDINVLYRRSAD